MSVDDLAEDDLPGMSKLDEDELVEAKMLYNIVFAGRAIERLMHENATLKAQLRHEKVMNKKWTELAAGYDPDLVFKCVIAGMDLADRKRKTGE